MRFEMDARSCMILAALTAATALAACKSETKTVGLLNIRDRAIPLSPATRAEIESRGGSCTPNPTGPVLCTWSSGGTTCELSYDTTDSLTHLQCHVDGLTWDCTRPAELYTCAWSDDMGCADVYTLDGVFEAYLCGQDLLDRIARGRPDAGTPDSGMTSGDDGGSDLCNTLDERDCVSKAGTCRTDYCPQCGGLRSFAGCTAESDPPTECRPLSCPDCPLLDQAACEAESSCHGVYSDRGNCGCAPEGCCIGFDRCEFGRADCTGLNVSCDRVAPSCGGEYVVSYSGTCYEGCALATACEPGEIACNANPPRYPSFDSACRTAGDCLAAIHQVDCCGTQHAIGINFAEHTRFEHAEGICESQYPGCGCASRGIECDDGVFVSGVDHVGVLCTDGKCNTVSRP